ncbi:MAG TPA: endo-1,4-beta-xylanase [Terriglobia bacterium]|nr:endo-1,4-beta-xylanase [Terriglobia bacterium]
MRRSDDLRWLRATSGVALGALLLLSCANSEEGTAVGTGGSPGSGGANSAGGGTTGTGGVLGSGGETGSGGAVGSGGNASGGNTGTGGTGTGGLSGGAGRGGTSGAAGGGAAGHAGSGGAALGGRDGGAGSSGRGGAAGSGSGIAGASGTGGTTGVGGSGHIQWPTKFLGNITQRGQIPSNFTTYWNQIVPENEGKWGSVEGTQGKYNWTALDNIHSFAKQHNIPFKQHNFVWGSQQPGWIGGLSQADQKAAVEDWIKQFCTRYPDTQMIDVLNEPPPHTTPPYLAALGGSGASGYDWVITIFKWARQYCPTSILIVNDYNIIEQSGDNNNMIKLVTSAMKGGAPIDAIGAQAHGLGNASASTTQMYIDKLASSTGVPVLISEFDLNIADDNQQKNQMQGLFTMFWNDTNVKGVTYWGYIQGETWETNTWLLSTGGTERSAMSWLMQFVGR